MYVLTPIYYNAYLSTTQKRGYAHAKTLFFIHCHKASWAYHEIGKKCLRIYIKILRNERNRNFFHEA